jgi:ABC-2 type transport system ATP-binding protein
VEEILKLSNLTKRYGCLPALDDVSLSLTSGKIIGLLGPNGSGKTTMMKICAGVLTPTSGDVQICGKPVGIESKALVSYLPDRTYLRGNQTLREQLEMFEDFYADFDRKRAEAMLADLRLDLNARFQTLSKGNREKVQLVLVMSRRAKLYLLDEPIGGVDPAARDYILNTIINNYDPSATVLISTHLISDVEQVLDSYIFVNQGKIIRAGSVDEAREETGGSLDQLFREVFRCLPNY